jgi:predicted restriction endonuclease
MTARTSGSATDLPGDWQSRDWSRQQGILGHISFQQLDKKVGTDQEHVAGESPWEESESRAEEISFPNDPAKLQERLELELPGECLEYLMRKSKSSGRSINELITQMVNNYLAQEN